jgi:hypothetical protein
MPTSRLLSVALAMVAAAAAFPMMATRTLPQDPRLPATGASDASLTMPQRQALRSQMTTLLDLHERLPAARSREERIAWLARSERVMSEGVALMRSMKRTLPVAESGELNSPFVTEAESYAINDFLALMDLLVQLRNDQNGLAAPTTPAEPVRPMSHRYPDSPLSTLQLLHVAQFLHGNDGALQAHVLGAVAPLNDDEASLLKTHRDLAVE